MTRRIYRNPPIEEALVEFQFLSENSWDSLLPFIFRERIKDIYPGAPKHKAKLEASIAAPTDTDGTVISVKQDRGRVQFTTKDERRLISLAHNILAVHALRPYPGWEELRNQIEHALRTYLDLVNVSGISRIGLRYINKLQITTQEAVSLDDYFVSPPNTPDGFPQQVCKFLCRMEHLYDGLPIRLIRTFADTEAPEGTVGFLLDLDLIWERKGEPLQVAEAMDIVDLLRDKEREAFELLITDRTRGVFDGAQTS